jgi:hydroxypyruvate isomerase
LELGRIGVCIEPLFSSLPYRQRIEQIHRLGFKYYEFWFHDKRYDGKNLVLERKNFEEIAELNEKYGLVTTDFVFNHPNGGISAALIDPRQRSYIVDSLGEIMACAKRIKCKALITASGNKIQGLAKEVAIESMIDTLKALAKECEREDITLLLEPFNTKIDRPDYFLDDPVLAVEVLKAVGSDKVKLLYDIYHMQIMSGNLVNFIRTFIQYIGHFHVAGVPGRHEPINNEVNYPYVIGEIKKLGYTGYIGLEYWPAMDDDESLRSTKKHLGM